MAEPVMTPELDKIPVKSLSVLSNIKPIELQIKKHEIYQKNFEKHNHVSIENMYYFLSGNGFHTPQVSHIMESPNIDIEDSY
mmetsp:Transcript_106628/g.130028  ORF Transcript_106628/g.130028 Transcript_106628/m.130028 type:complete len:82 (+) Transcript_106628:1-246(+)